MELIANSIRNVFFGLIVAIINIPIFWSFSELINFVRNAVKIIGIEV